jgi:hypothetical protein
MARSKSAKKTTSASPKKKPGGARRWSWKRLALGVLALMVAAGAALAFLPVLGVGLRLGRISLTGALTPPGLAPGPGQRRLVDYELDRRTRGRIREWRVRVRDRVWMLRVG